MISCGEWRDEFLFEKRFFISAGKTRGRVRPGKKELTLRCFMALTYFFEARDVSVLG